MMTYQVLNWNSFTIDFNVAYDIIESYIYSLTFSTNTSKIANYYSKSKNSQSKFQNEIEQFEIQNSEGQKYHRR